MQMMQGMGGAGAMGGMPGAAGGQQQNPMGGAGANPFGMYGGMGGMDPAMMQAMMGGGQPPASTDTRPPREKYAEQLVQIKEMGFNDEEAILQILVQTGGNVQLALEKLFM